MKPSKFRFLELTTSVAIAIVVTWFVLGSEFNKSAAHQSNFVGGEPQREAADDARIIRLRFTAGSRSNWHYHSTGQLLMIIEGRALTQVRGEPVREMFPGEPWYTDAGVEHWHGAHPQIDAYQLTISMGTTNWLEPVSDEQYLAPSTR